MRSPFVTVVLAVVGLYLMFLAVPDLGPAIRASRADGSPGVFTAQQQSCAKHPGHQSCTWLGGFRSDDGTIKRDQVALKGSGRNSLTVGATTRAVDIGRANRVYRPGGSDEWVFTVLLLVAGAAITTFAFTRPRPRPRTPAERQEYGHGRVSQS